MAATKGSFNKASASKTPGITVKGLTSTAFQIQDGGATGSRMFHLVVDNSSNSALSYLKLWDNNGSPTENSTIPDLILPVAASSKICVTMPNGHGVNKIWTSANQMHAITTSVKASGNTGNTETQTAPSTAIDCQFGILVT